MGKTEYKLKLQKQKPIVSESKRLVLRLQYIITEPNSSDDDKYVHNTISLSVTQHNQHYQFVNDKAFQPEHAVAFVPSLARTPFSK